MRTPALACLILLLLPFLAATAVAEDGADERTKLKNTVRWTTASEVDNFGFDVYRATKADGPFERLTAKPIPGSGTSDVPSEYKWVDDTIEAGREYYYYVEAISMSGEREQFTPIFRAAPKSPASQSQTDPAPGD